MKVLANRDAIGGVSLVDGDTSLGSALMLLMDELAHGVVVTTVEGRLLHANLAGHRELGRGRVLELRHHVLRALTPPLDFPARLCGLGLGARDLRQRWPRRPRANAA